MRVIGWLVALALGYALGAGSLAHASGEFYVTPEGAESARYLMGVVEPSDDGLAHCDAQNEALFAIEDARTRAFVFELGYRLAYTFEGRGYCAGE